MTTGTCLSVSRSRAMSRSLPGKVTGAPVREKNREQMSPTASTSATEEVSMNCGACARSSGGAPTPVRTQRACGHRWSTRWIVGSCWSVSYSSGPGSAGAKRYMARPPTRSATRRLISLVWYQASGWSVPPTVGATTTPGSCGSSKRETS